MRSDVETEYKKMFIAHVSVKQRTKQAFIRFNLCDLRIY